jgi:hypothetical protein
MNRRKLAELTSGIGALMLGLGLGAWFAPWLVRVAAPIVAVGLGAHAFGMWDGHRLDADKHFDSPRWLTALYGLCWFSLAMVLAALLWNWGIP